jgi:hypothetical protein
MRSNVKTIKLTTGLSLLFAVVTYFISIKDVLEVRSIKWLPDAFLFAVFGGAFASMLVVLICEISKYFENRENTETFLFSHLYYLYGQFQVIQKNVDFLITHLDQIHKDVLKQLIYNSEAEMNAIYYADYVPFKSDNLILAEKAKYNSEVFPTIQRFLQNCRMFELAVLTDSITKNERNLGIDKGSDDNAYIVLKKLSKDIQKPLTLLDEMLIRIDQLCNGRYNWIQIRDNMIKGLPDNRTDMLELFLDKESVFWFCDNCDTFLNMQQGFTTRNQHWKCTECGFDNDVRKYDID